VSNVYICAIESQRKAFSERVALIKKMDAITTVAYEENSKVNEYQIGLRALHEVNAGKNTSEHSDEEESDDSLGVKIIRYDEDIEAIFCARNISPYGFIAIVGQSKLSIYLAYSDDTSCTYDHVWTINFWDFRKLNIGRKIELVDFSNNCEEFIAYTNTGVLVVFDLKKHKYSHKITELNYRRLGPLTKIRSI